MGVWWVTDLSEPGALAAVPLTPAVVQASPCPHWGHGLQQASVSGRWAVEVRAAAQCAAMPGWSAPTAAFHSSSRRPTPMLSLRASDGRVATRAPRARTEHRIITATIAIEERALRAAAALTAAIPGSAPALR